MKKNILAASQFKIKKSKLKSAFASCLSFLLFTFYFLIDVSAQPGSWSAKANFGGAGRSNAVGFSIGSYGYIGTGYTGTVLKDFWRYDPVADSWSQMADFGGTARRAAVGFAVGNYGYIGTGLDVNNIYIKDFWKYDVAGNSWLQVADFGGTARFYAAGFSIGNNGYVGTGFDGSTAYNDFWKYNSLTDTWTSKTNFGGSIRGDCFAFAVSGKGYIGCGRNFSASTYYNSFYEYDTTANAWTAKATFGGSVREGVSAFVIGNYGYAGTGGDNNFSSLYVDFYKYDPAGNTWTSVANFIGAARGSAAAFAVGNYGYVGTGYTGGYVNTFYQYDLCGVTTTITATAPSCNGGSNGSINLTVAGATNPLTYAWSNASTVEDPAGLSAGGYTVTVTDGLGCTKTTTVSVSQPTVLAGNITTVTNASCYSLCNGKITVAASGATPSYAYLWAPSVSSTATASNLCAGNYSVTITDTKGCATLLDTVITQPSALVAAAGGTNATSGCSCDGILNAAGTGGTAPFTYLWSTGCTSPICSNICGSNSAYTVTVTDNKGCAAIDTVSILPLPLIVNITCNSVSCNGGNNGSSSALVSGGNSPYTYSWSTVPVQNTQTATGLSVGNYTVTVTDADGCTTVSSCFVTQPAALQVFNINTTANSSGCLCDGTVSANVVGGTTPYTYNWSSGCMTMSCTGLCGGVYAVNVTDAMGCIATKTATVTGPMAFVIDSVNALPASCSTCPNGSVTAYVSTGVGPYSYSWAPGGATSQTANGLIPGTYTVCATDAGGCTSCDSVSVGNNSGVIEYKESNLIIIYPVPVKDKFTLRINTPVPSSAEIKIYDIYGREVYASPLSPLSFLPSPLGEGAGVRQGEVIDVSSFPSGMYDLVISCSKMILTKKIIIK